MPIEDLLDAGALVARLEKLDRVFCNVGLHWLRLTVARDKIVEIDVISDPPRLQQLDLALLNN